MKPTKTRAGSFSSSSIWKLMTNSKQGGIGAPGLTYIKEKLLEIKLGRQLQQEKNARAASWGNLCERYVYLLLSVDYKPTEKGNRKQHPDFPDHWTGEEDFTRKDIVGDIKCFELKNFCQTHDAFSLLGYELLKEECPEIFWQLVSGAILCKKKKAELVLYVPYKKELDSIRAEAEESDNPKFAWRNTQRIMNSHILLKEITTKTFQSLNLRLRMRTKRR